MAISNKELDDLFIPALNTQHNFMAYLGELTKILSKTPNFFSFEIKKKHEFFDSILQDSQYYWLLQKYKDYSYQSFLKDLSADIVFNLKLERFVNYEAFSRLASYFSLFFVLKSFEIKENCQELVFTYEKNTSLFEYIVFLTNELSSFRHHEAIEVFIHVHNLMGVLIAFFRNFLEISSVYAFSSPNQQDFSGICSLLMRFIEVLANEPSGLFLQDMILRGECGDFWELQQKQLTSSWTLSIILKGLQHEKYEDSLIKNYYRENFSRFFHENLNCEELLVVIEIAVELKLTKKFAVLLNFIQEKFYFLIKNGVFDTVISTICELSSIISSDSTKSSKEKEDFITNIYDFLVQIYEKLLDTEHKSCIKSLLSSLFSVICQNPMISFTTPLKKLMKTIHKADYECLNLLISIINYSFLVSPTKLLLLSQDFTAIFFEIFLCKAADSLVILLLTAQRVLKERDFEVSKEAFMVLLEILSHVLRKEENFIGRYRGNALKNLLILTKIALKKRKNLFSMLKDHKIYDFLLKIDEDPGFLDFRVFLLKQEIKLFGNKNLRKYCEIMLEGAKNKGVIDLVKEIESFKKLEVFLNILLMVKKLMSKKPLRKIFKEIRVFEHFFELLPALLQRKSQENVRFVKDFLFLIRVLCYNSEEVQFFVNKRRFLEEKVYFLLENAGLLKECTLFSSLLTLGFINYPSFRRENQFFREETHEIVQKHEEFEALADETHNFYKNFIVIHENLQLFFRFCWKSLDFQQKSGFFKEFFEVFQGDFLSTLFLRLIKPLKDVFFQEKRLFHENIANIFQVFAENGYKVPSKSSIFPEILLEMLEYSNINATNPEKFSENFIELLQKAQFSMRETAFLPGNVLFFPTKALESPCFSLIAWLKVRKISESPRKLLFFLDFQDFKPFCAVSLQAKTLEIAYSEQKSKSLGLNFAENEWFLLGLSCFQRKNEVFFAIFVNGIAMGSVCFSSNEENKRKLHVLFGNPKKSASKHEEIQQNQWFLGPFRLYSLEFQEKEMNFLYLLSTHTGSLHRNRLNLGLIHAENLHFLDIKQSISLQTANFRCDRGKLTGNLYCYLPNYRQNLLLSCDFAGMYWISRKKLCENSQISALKRLLDVESRTFFEVFLDLKACFSQTLRKDAILCVKQGFFLGNFKETQLHAMVLQSNNGSFLEACAQSGFLSDLFAVFRRKTVSFDVLLRILVMSCKVSEEIFEELGVYKDLLRNLFANLGKTERKESFIESLLELCVRKVADCHSFLNSPAIFLEVFLDLEVIGSNFGMYASSLQRIGEFFVEKHNIFYEVNCAILRSKKVLCLLLEALIYGLFSEKDSLKMRDFLFLALEKPSFLEQSLEILLDFTSLAFLYERKDASFARKSAAFPYKLQENHLLFSQELLCNLFEKLLESNSFNAKVLNPNIFIGFLKSKADNCLQNAEKFASLCEKPRFFASCRGFLCCFFKAFAHCPAGFAEDDDFETYLSVLAPYINGISTFLCDFQRFFEGNNGFLRKKLLFLLNCVALSCENFAKILEIVVKNDVLEQEKTEKIAVSRENEGKSGEVCLDLFQIFQQSKGESPLKQPFSLLRMESAEKIDKKSRIFEIFFKENEENQENYSEILIKLYQMEVFLFFLPNQCLLEKRLNDLMSLLSFSEISFENTGELEGFLDVLLKILNYQQNIADIIKSEKLDNCKNSLDFGALNETIFQILWKLFVSKGLCVNKLENYLEIIEKSLDNETNYLSILLKVLEAFADANLMEERENAFFLSYTKKLLTRLLPRAIHSEMHLALNLLFLKLRKIFEKPAVSPTKSSKLPAELRTSEILRVEPNRNKTKKKAISLNYLYECLQSLIKSLVLVNLNAGLPSKNEAKSTGNEESNHIVELELRLYIFNEDLLFDIRYENQEFLAALMYILWQIISGDFLLKNKQNAVLLLAYLPQYFPKTFELSLSLGDISAYEQAFDHLPLLNKQSKAEINEITLKNNGDSISFTTEDFLDFILSDSSRKQRIDTVINKKLWTFYMNFLNDLDFCKEEEPDSAVRKSSFFSSFNSRTKSLSLSFVLDSSLMKIPSFFYLSTVKEKIDGAPLKFAESEARFLYKRQRNAQFLKKNSKNLEIKQYFQSKKGENYSNIMRFSCKLSKKIGPCYERKVLHLTKEPEILQCYRDSPNSRRNSSNNQPVPVENSYKNLNLLPTEVIENPGNEAKKAVEDSVFLEFFSQSSAKKLEKLLKIFEIEEKIVTYYSIALLKDCLVDSLLLFGSTKLYIIENFVVDAAGYPMESFMVSRDNEYDKAKWFIKKKDSNTNINSVFNCNILNLIPVFNKEHKLYAVPYHEILETHTKSYLLRPCSIELFLENRTFFLITNQYERDEIFMKLSYSLVKSPNKLSKAPVSFIISGEKGPISADTLLSSLISLWEQGKLSNYHYIMLLNIISGRTYSDLSQYPVFPWILSDYASEFLEITNPNIYRDLSKPIGALTEEKTQAAKEKFHYTSEEKLFPGFHFGSHYSSAALILHYLFRILPFTLDAMNLQGGKFDISDRLFHCLHDSWGLAYNLEVKELIPELFYFPEGLVNINQINFGLTQINEKVNDLKLPQWARGDPRVFITLMKRVFESSLVSMNLNKWIDLIFGYKQRGKPAVDAVNLYFFLTYEGAIKIEKLGFNERNGLLDQIMEYGQTPRQLFSTAHAEKKKSIRSQAFFYSKKTLEKMGFEIYHILQGVHEGFCITFEEKGKIHKNTRGIFNGFANSVNNISNLINKEEPFFPGNTAETLTEMLILYQKQCFLTVAKHKDAHILDYSSSKELTIIKNNRVCQTFQSPSNNISKIGSNSQRKMLIICTSFGQISFYHYEETFNKTNDPTGLVFEGPISKEIRLISYGLQSPCEKQNIFEEFPVMKRSYTNKTTSSSQNPLRKSIVHHTMTPKPRQTGSFLFKDKSVLTLHEAIHEEKVFHFLHKATFSGYHHKSIAFLEVSKSFGLVLSLDEDGFLCTWDIIGSFIRKFRVPHLLNARIFRKLCEEKTDYINFNVDFEETMVETPKFLSFLEQTGDFAIVSSNYVSLYTINGVLLAIERCEKAHFSCCLLLQNAEVFEEDYLLTGHEDGLIKLWILEKVDVKNSCSGQYYRDSLHNWSQKPFKLVCVYVFSLLSENFFAEDFFSDSNNRKELMVVGLTVSHDQKRMYSCHKNSEIYKWEVSVAATNENEENSKKCASCKVNFGLLDKKFICARCNSFLCGNCSKNEIIVAEVSLRKPSKVCVECYKLSQEKKILGLYDNY